MTDLGGDQITSHLQLGTGTGTPSLCHCVRLTIFRRREHNQTLYTCTFERVRRIPFLHIIEQIEGGVLERKIRGRGNYFLYIIYSL